MRAAAAALAVLILAGEARAADEVTVYPASFFAAAQPYSALDMVRRLPGFSLDAGDDEVRGLAGAAGNVLIDGERPPSKEDLEDVLARLPAGDVERIDLVRGASAGIDMRGHSVVANIVRRRGATAAGQVEAGLFAYATGGLAPQLRAQRSERRGERLLEGAIHLYREPDDEGGQGARRRFGPLGGLDRDARYAVDAHTDGASLKGGYETPLAGGRLQVRLSADRERTSAVTDERRRFPEAESSRQREREALDALEAGFNFDRTIPAGELSLVGLQRLRRTTEHEAVSGDAEDERFDSRATAGESVAAATLQRRLGPRLEGQVGLEAAYNFLEGHAALEEAGEPVDLPSADVDVREWRGELSGSVSWRPAAGWLVETGGRLEASRLRHAGDAALEKSLTYLKPRVLLVRELGPGRELRFRLEREVGQLDFEDFAASASLVSGVVSAGNADLEPETAWVVEAAYEQPLLERGAIVATFRENRIDNVLDRLAAPGEDEPFDAPGNIGRGWRREVELSLTLPLETFGVPGGLLTGEVIWVRSSVRDPTTGRRRRISGDEPLEGEAHFSQDLPAHRFRWGVDVVAAETEWEFRFDEVEQTRTGTWVAAFAEYVPAPRWRLRLEAGNLGRRSVRRFRELYGGPRDRAALEGREVRQVRFGPFVGLSVRRGL